MKNSPAQGRVDSAEVLSVLALARPYIERASYDRTDEPSIRLEAKRRLARLDALYKTLREPGATATPGDKA